MEGPPPEARRARGQDTAVAAVLALVSFLPFLRGTLSGQSLYFRDLSLHFFPLRRYAVEGLRNLELRFWNPYVHEGVPLSLPPVSYPIDLLQTVLSDERGFSLLLAAHVSLAALALFALGRCLGLSRLAAAGGGLVYALGGFCLSTVNLYVYLQAMAWAPLALLALVRAAEGGRRETAWAAVALALTLSTTGAEIALQTILCGLVLAASFRRPSPWLRLGTALALALGLASYTLLPLSGLVAGSSRGEGFATEVVLAHSIHPFTLVQTVVGGLYGDLSRLPGRWWGQNFFPLGFPYVLSLYLGLTTLCVAATGARHGGAFRRRLPILILLALVAGLGHWAGLEPLVDAVPALRRFRYPSKAFFTVHLAVALLVALGLDALARGTERRPWRWLAGLGLGFGGLLASAPLVPWLLPGPSHWFLARFFPPHDPWLLRVDRLQYVLHDAALGGLVAAAAGLLALLVVGGRLKPGLAALAVTALIAADLLRTGAGLNPMVTPTFFEPSAELARELPRLREGGRVFTCSTGDSRAYLDARVEKGEKHEAWTFAVLSETLTPDFNLAARVPAAYSADLTMLVPLSRVLSYREAGCATFEAIADRLRQAGVSHVLSLDPLESPDLRLESVLTPARIRPLAVHVYRLRDSLPLRAVSEGGQIVSLVERSNRIDLDVEANHPSLLVLREALAPGWTAAVQGVAARLLTVDEHRRALLVPGGHSRITLAYHPPFLRVGVVLSAVSVALVGILMLRGRSRGIPGTSAQV